VNLVLITETEPTTGFAPTDERYQHLCETVGVKVGATFYVGIPNGLRGLAKVTSLEPRLTFTVTWEKNLQPRLPLHVVVGLPRPQTAKKVLHDLASLGVESINFFDSEKGDAGYATSSLWKDDQWLEPLRKGAEQACSSHLPQVHRHASLVLALAALPQTSNRLALDPYEASEALGSVPVTTPSAILALGPERGWSAKERNLLRENQFKFYHLGDRILRVEAAALVGSALVLSQLKVWQVHQPLQT
jgi:RsmE family RNA methyltransferase